MKYFIQLADECASLCFGESLAKEFVAQSTSRLMVYLSGTLGAGKTTLTRGILRGFGYQGAVKSPTYTLVEPYELAQVNVYHFDLYRLGDPEELEFMGVRDYFSMPVEGEAPRLCIIEWPEQGGALLPPADLHVRLEVAGAGRKMVLQAADHLSESWQCWCDQFASTQAS
ncbi:MAG: tRNA (adenosine(37)-N6)-threonylcarbamoyltransferase complex ATPase subunit type 1 TsaE [Oleiphilaceae bacterium]|nr:tRNA (adenosine(37)-N6)-threonylcarbamoyltransferase complex ATPase subunit type 1 TsaE [Oleiphilaceae bacterium]